MECYKPRANLYNIRFERLSRDWDYIITVLFFFNHVYLWSVKLHISRSEQSEMQMCVNTACGSKGKSSKKR